MKHDGLVLLQAKCLSESFNRSSGLDYSWQNLDREVRCDLCNLVVSFHTRDTKNWEANNVVYYSQRVARLMGYKRIVHEINEVLMCTTMCLAYTKSEILKDLFILDEITTPLVRNFDVKWRWSSPKDFACKGGCDDNCDCMW